MNKIKYILATFLFAGFLVSCEKDDFTGHSRLTPSNPTITVTAPATVPAMETGNTFEFTVTLSEPQIVDVAVHITTIGGTATEGEDFVINNSSGRLVIPAYRTSGKVSITVLADVEAEEDETFTIQIGDERTANATITPVEVDFTIANVTEDDLALELEWGAEVFDSEGETVDGDAIADLIFYITDENDVVLETIDGATYEEYVLLGTEPDGLYKLKVGVYSAIDPGDLGSIPPLDLALNFSQVGTIDASTFDFASILPAVVCSSNIVTIATIDKSGTDYTLTKTGEFDFDLASFTGFTYDCDEPGYGVYDVTFSLNGCNTILVDNFWDSGFEVNYVLNPSNGTVTIPLQVVDGYRIEGAGTFDYVTKTLVVPYTVKDDSDGSLIDSNTHTFTVQ
jgi:hypothetical protein